MSPRPVPIRRVRWVAAAVAVVGLMLGSSRASAETVSLNFSKTTGTAPVGVAYTIGTTTTTTSITPGPYYWQQTGSPLNSNFGSTVATFCVELNQGFAASSASYTVSALGAVKSAATTDAIQKLFANNYNSAWASSTFTGSTASTAFQLALWELVYDGPGGALGTGNFKYTGSLTSGVGLAAVNMLSALAGTSSTAFNSLFPNSQVVWLSNGSYQDQITLAPKAPQPPGVPAPPSIILAGLALGTGLFGRVLRRRKVAEVVS
jgi:hypothetical protein